MPVWIYSGTVDSYVIQNVVDHTATFFRDFESNVKYVNDHVGEHAFPTDLARNKNACTALARPGISNCHFDGVGDMFNHIIPNQDQKPLNPRDLDWQKHGKIIEFDQSEFIDPNFDQSRTGIDSTGFAYIPTSCSQGAEC
jgi:hypothetical protein